MRAAEHLEGSDPSFSRRKGAPVATARTSVPPGVQVQGLIARYEQEIIDRVADFNDPRQEWRRLISELLGTFFLVLAAAGGGMMGHAFPGVISHTDAVVAPALTVLAIILFMGKSRARI